MESELLASRHGIECQSSGLFFLCMKYDLQCWEVLSLPDIQRTKKAQVLGSIGQILTQSFFKDLFIMQFAAACLTHTQWVIDFLFKVMNRYAKLAAFSTGILISFLQSLLLQVPPFLTRVFREFRGHLIYSQIMYISAFSVGKNGSPKNSL